MLGLVTVAAQLAIVAHAPDTVAACDAVEVSVAVSARGGGSAVPRLLTPSFAPFQLLRGTRAPRVEYEARASLMAEYRFTLTTDRIGQFTIPAFEARLGGERVQSRPLRVTVRQRRGRGAPTLLTRARIDTSPDVDLRSAAVVDTVYVGQQATYEVAVFLNQTVRERLRRNPTFYPPEMQAMLAYDLPVPTPGGASPSGRTGSQCFDALVYRRALFPLVAGRLVIPPAQLVYSTSQSFSREESHELETDSVAIVAVDPPSSTRPAEYHGAVGSFRVDARLDSTRSRVGDPLLLTVSVEGSGNVKLFPRPAVRIPWAGLVPADVRVRIDSTNARIRGVKEFDWVLTPRIAGELDVPPVRYGYFDPARGRYDVAVAPGSRIRVGAGSLAMADTAQADASGPLAIRARYGGPSWPPPQSQLAFWLAIAFVPLPAIVSRLRRRPLRQRAVARDPLSALVVAARLAEPATLRRNFVRSLARRLGCSPEDFTHPGALDRALRRAGVSEDTAARADGLLRELDLAAYTPSASLPPNAARNAVALARAVDAEALARRELPFWIPVVLLALSLVAIGSAVAADGAETHFARGVSAYLRQDYAAARDAFTEAATLAPSAPDAWANYGTASWAIADTSAAVLGWRQALAIEPAASDLRQRLDLVRSESPGSPGWVPSLPRNATVWTFALLWIAAWAFAWRSAGPARHRPWVQRLPIPLAACALLVGLASIELEARISGARLAVVRRHAALTSHPAIGMDRGPAVGTGEIVHVAGRRGTWSRVEAAGGRDGWIASAQLLRLDERHPPRD